MVNVCKLVAFVVFCSFRAARSTSYWEHNSEFFKNIYNARIKDHFFQSRSRVAKNIVLFLVEGMDQPTLALARKIGDELDPSQNPLWSLDRYTTGLARASSRDFLAADPAAASSAIFNGVPERNGQMGWVEQPDVANCTVYNTKLKSTENLFKIMMEAGVSTGLVSTASLTSPGVAGIYGSSPDMNLKSDTNLREAGCSGGQLEDLAKQLLMNYRDLNLIVGGGLNDFQKQTVMDPLSRSSMPNSRADMDLKTFWAMDKLLKRKSYSQFVGAAEAQAMLLSRTALSEHILGFLWRDENTEQHLETVMKLAFRQMRKLKSGSGYFLVFHTDIVSRDHKESKANGAAAGVHQVLSHLDKALNNVDLTETLVVLASTQGSTMSVTGNVPLSSRVTGMGATENCEPMSFLNYATGPARSHVTPVPTSLSDTLKHQYPNKYFSPVGLPGASDLPVFAYGPNSHLFTGVYDQAYLYHALLAASCLGQASHKYQHCNLLDLTNVAGHSWNQHQSKATATSTPSTTTTTTTTSTTLKPKSPSYNYFNKPGADPTNVINNSTSRNAESPSQNNYISGNNKRNKNHNYFNTNNDVNRIYPDNRRSRYNNYNRNYNNGFNYNRGFNNFNNLFGFSNGNSNNYNRNSMNNMNGYNSANNYNTNSGRNNYNMNANNNNNNNIDNRRFPQNPSQQTNTNRNYWNGNFNGNTLNGQNSVDQLPMNGNNNSPTIPTNSRNDYSHNVQSDITIPSARSGNRRMGYNNSYSRYSANYQGQGSNQGRSDRYGTNRNRNYNSWLWASMIPALM